METYAVLHRGCWREPAELHAAIARSSFECERSAGVRWISGYVLAEPDGELGLLCIFRAPGPDALRAHAYRAGMPVDEIVPVIDTLATTIGATAASTPDTARPSTPSDRIPTPHPGGTS